jgi:hypothetical protein
MVTDVEKYWRSQFNLSRKMINLGKELSLIFPYLSSEEQEQLLDDYREGRYETLRGFLDNKRKA